MGGMRGGLQRYKEQPITSAEEAAANAAVHVDLRKKADRWQGKIQKTKLQKSKESARRRAARGGKDGAACTEVAMENGWAVHGNSLKREAKMLKKARKARDKAAIKAKKMGLPIPPSLAEARAQERDAEREAERVRYLEGIE